jgi:hypothetical protein
VLRAGRMYACDCIAVSLMKTLRGHWVVRAIAHTSLCMRQAAAASAAFFSFHYQHWACEQEPGVGQGGAQAARERAGDSACQRNSEHPPGVRSAAAALRRAAQLRRAHEQLDRHAAHERCWICGWVWWCRALARRDVAGAAVLGHWERSGRHAGTPSEPCARAGGWWGLSVDFEQQGLDYILKVIACAAAPSHNAAH